MLFHPFKIFYDEDNKKYYKWFTQCPNCKSTEIKYQLPDDQMPNICNSCHKHNIEETTVEITKNEFDKLLSLFNRQISLYSIQRQINELVYK